MQPFIGFGQPKELHHVLATACAFCVVHCAGGIGGGAGAGDAQ